MELCYTLSHKPLFQLLLYILLLMSQSYKITILPNTMTAFVVMETLIIPSHLCTDPLPQDPPPFQPSVTKGSHGLPCGLTGDGVRGPERLVVVVLGECWWSQGTLLPSWTRLYTCSFSPRWLAPPVVPSGLLKCDLSQLVLISVISGLGIPWVSQSSISSFILSWFYQVVIGFPQTTCFWVKQIQQLLFVGGGVLLTIKLWFAWLSGTKLRW